MILVSCISSSVLEHGATEGKEAASVSCCASAEQQRLKLQLDMQLSEEGCPSTSMQSAVKTFVEHTEVRLSCFVAQ